MPPTRPPFRLRGAGGYTFFLCTTTPTAPHPHHPPPNTTYNHNTNERTPPSITPLFLIWGLGGNQVTHLKETTARQRSDKRINLPFLGHTAVTAASHTAPAKNNAVRSFTRRADAPCYYSTSRSSTEHASEFEFAPKTAIGRLLAFYLKIETPP